MSSATVRGRQKRWRVILWLESTREYQVSVLSSTGHSLIVPPHYWLSKEPQMATEDVKFAYPDPNETMSKRQWEKAVAAWRAALRNAVDSDAGEGAMSAQVQV